MLRAHLEWLCSNGLPLGHHCCGWLHRNASSLRGCWPETVKRSTYPSKPWHMRIWPLYALWRLVASLSHSTSMACPSMYVLPSGFSLSLGSHTRRVPETLKVIRRRVDKYESLCQQRSINYEGWGGSSIREDCPKCTNQEARPHTAEKVRSKSSLHPNCLWWHLYLASAQSPGNVDSKRWCVSLGKLYSDL